MDDDYDMYMLSTCVCWLLLLTTLPQSHSQADDPYCKQLPYNCGLVYDIPYPFWGQSQPAQCHGLDQFELICNYDDNTTSIRFGSHNFTVEHIEVTTHTMRLVRTDLAPDLCSRQIEDIRIPTPFWYPSSVYNISVFYDCSFLSHSIPKERLIFDCENNRGLFYEGVVDQLPGLLHACQEHAQVPLDKSLGYKNDDPLKYLEDALKEGFSLSYNFPNTDKKSHHRLLKRKVIVGIATAIIGGFMICIIICYFIYKIGLVSTKSDQDIEAFLKINGAIAQKRYKFSQVKEMTNSFKDKLGQGGFGAVYKGKLSTSFPVAVKLLNASKGNGEEFINEIASISRTSHINIVTLLGFCLEGRKKALIYEFMANGSLDNFIYKRGSETIASLSWENLYQISIGIARGLEYLHRGCNTRILHFDIKPHNILLDENFCPKISDFGLAKLCPRKESIISMSDTRGTMGYVAPEMCNRQFGGVSHKSDVYSYGMMLLEMVGGRKNINAEASHTSEIYFPYLVYKRLELDNDVRPDEVMNTEENQIAKRMTIVGLWCIQTFPSDRPTMSRVVDMLEGNMNSLEMPPKPLLSSPTRSESSS